MEDTLKYYIRGALAVVGLFVLLWASYNIGQQQITNDVIQTCSDDGIIKIMSDVFKCERFSLNVYGK